MPQLAVEGELDLPDDVLLLDGVTDVPALEAAHAAGRPVVVRTDSPDAIRAALARPEVAAALVPPEARHLLDLDLTELTYG